MSVTTTLKFLTEVYGVLLYGNTLSIIVYLCKRTAGVDKSKSSFICFENQMTAFIKHDPR